MTPQDRAKVLVYVRSLHGFFQTSTLRQRVRLTYSHLDFDELFALVDKELDRLAILEGE